MMNAPMTDPALRRATRFVGLLNLGYFGIEFAVALAIGSVSLFADSVDFLEDASVNFLILAALGWSTRRRAKVGMLLAGILLIPGIATLWTALAQGQRASGTQSGAVVIDRSRRSGDQSVLRVDAGALPPSRWQPHAGGLPVRPK